MQLIKFSVNETFNITFAVHVLQHVTSNIFYCYSLAAVIAAFRKYIRSFFSVSWTPPSIVTYTNSFQLRKTEWPTEEKKSTWALERTPAPRIPFH